jgi:hypothetical protein
LTAKEAVMVSDKDDMFAPEEVTQEDEFGGLDNEPVLAIEKPVEAPVEAPEKPVEAPVPFEAVPVPLEVSEAPVAFRKAKKANSGKKEDGEGEKKRRTLTRVQKAIRLMLRRSGKEVMPPLDELMKGKAGKRVTISEIGIFAGSPKDALIAELAAECMLGNTLNFSAEITKLRMLQVGTQILKAGRMHTPIFVAQITENDSLQCVSGRHRLAFLILAYGADAKVPVYIENMSLEEARDAMGVANDNRPAKAQERAELAVLKAMKGKSNVGQDELYTQMATSKPNARKYCVYSVMERAYPLSLNFKVSATASRKDGGLTTLSNVETFLGAALEWNPETTRKDFDKALKNAVIFINELASAFQKNPDFDPDFHMTAKPMSAIGRNYWDYIVAGNNAIVVVGQVADKIISMGDVSRMSAEDIYDRLASDLMPKG